MCAQVLVNLRLGAAHDHQLDAEAMQERDVVQQQRHAVLALNHLRPCPRGTWACLGGRHTDLEDGNEATHRA